MLRVLIDVGTGKRYAQRISVRRVNETVIAARALAGTRAESRSRDRRHAAFAQLGSTSERSEPLVRQRRPS